MPKYNVHLYVTVRVKLDGIEAESQEKSVDLAIAQFQKTPADYIAKSTDNYAEEITTALVDEEGDEDFVHTREHKVV